MSMVIELECKHCGAPLDLDADVVDVDDGRKLDIKLTCEGCNAPVVFCFVPLSDFMDNNGNSPYVSEED